jgi:hypothetical protein
VTVSVASLPFYETDSCFVFLQLEPQEIYFMKMFLRQSVGNVII